MSVLLYSGIESHLRVPLSSLKGTFFRFYVKHVVGHDLKKMFLFSTFFGDDVNKFLLMLKNKIEEILYHIFLKRVDDTVFVRQAEDFLLY